MAQRYEYGWTGHFKEGGEPYEEGEGYESKAKVLQDVQVMRAQEKASLKGGFQTEETFVEYKVRRRPVFVIPEWEEVAG